MENNEFKWLSFKVEDDYFVHILLDNASQKILSESKYYKFKQYSARCDSPHSNNGQKHLHFYVRGNQLFALNKDGTAHDGKLSHKKKHTQRGCRFYP